MTARQSSPERRPVARIELDRHRAHLAARARAELPVHDAEALLARCERRVLDVSEPIGRLYGDGHDLDALMRRLLDIVVDAAVARPDALRRLDHRREIIPDWYLHERMVGYVCYADRFAGRLDKVADHLDYLLELGVTYLHLMPLLRSREGPDDGGYAVTDYRCVDPALGDMQDLERLAGTLRDRGVSLCVDLVVNHTAREHVWAQRALAGDPDYRDYYLIYPDRTLPDRYSATLPEVFPDTAPGNFTWVPQLDGWVWTTFHDYQWDLNYANPRVLAEMLDVMLFLANRGVEVLRLDAVPFMWKRMGTDCQNQPEVHALLQVLRGLVGMAAPAVIFKAEAIVEPGQLVRYLGAHDRHRPECELAYHNQLMVMLWSSLAARDARMMTHALARMITPPLGTSWVTYLRCHDDIGWAVTDEDANSVFVDGFGHRRFLTDFYSGAFPGSYARGATFQANPRTGDARISGTAASLCGIEQALWESDPELLELAERRMLLCYGVVAAFGGIPLLYMGDELALRNDRAYADCPEHAGDNRWMHRPAMDWDAAARRTDPTTLEGRLFAGLQRLLRVRCQLPALRGGYATHPLYTDNPHVFAFARRHPRTGPFLGLANFSQETETVDASILGRSGLAHPRDALAAPGEPFLRAGRVTLPPLGLRWLTED